ncbi:unnamed protein product [Sphagnum jensenii]|uniref:Uncharacterized protein n=1 Tax=Sphagnum jensenii TaxID=128206 RepID=A0ABP0V631_9BRYO
MEGHWIGEGSRSYPISGRTTQVTAEVTSTVTTASGQERLNSDNRVTETQANAAPQIYHTVYWIEAKAGQPEVYILGAAQSASSTGTFSLKEGVAVFVSDQDLGGGYTIHSETQFSELLRNAIKTSAMSVRLAII